jgi:serine/threonine protein kinase
MGEVYKARDSVINRTVALKTITTNLANNKDLLERFYQEARAAGTLQHPNIVTIFELNKEGDTPYIAMEFLEGESLEKIIARKATLTVSEKLSYIVPVCRALDYAHKRGIVHRDVKPANIVVSNDGAVKVVDFGIARLVDGGLTQTNMLIGTIAYMSPQQIQGDRADERSDIWAMGVTCWELIAGERPFNGDNHAALMMKIISGDPPPLSEKDPGSPADLDAVVARMMNKDIVERFQTMEEVLLELEPVWRRIQLGTVSQLVANGRSLLDSQDLLRAQRLLREALQIDSSNSEARILLEKTNTAIRRSQVLPRLHERIEKGGQLLASGLPQEARVEAEAALKIDSSFEPARSLLAGVQAANDYARLVGDGLRIAKQFLASGAILDADQKLETVLSLDPENRTALELREHVREEVERRQKRQQLSEAIKRARQLWTEQQYDECLRLLAEMEKEYAGDPEVLRLRDAVLQDQHEQEKSARLAEARKLVARQHFDGALSILSGLIENHPEDSGIKSFRALVLQQKEGEAREKKTSTQLEELRALLGSGKYQEAIDKGETLLRDSPQDFELREVVKFAREEMSQGTRKQRLEELITQINEVCLAHRFAEAIKLAERGLVEFPGNSELQEQLESAKLEQKDQEGRDRIQEHIREIEALIHNDELTEAIDVARKTLITVGPSTAVTHLLKTAEFEYKTRAKQKEQKLGLETLQTLVSSGKLEEAKTALHASIKTELFEPFDPRIESLRESIADKEAQLVAPASPVAPSGTFAKDYVFQQGSPVASPPKVSPQANAASPQSQTGAASPPSVLPSAPPASTPQPTVSQASQVAPPAIPAPQIGPSGSGVHPPPVPPRVSPKAKSPDKAAPPTAAGIPAWAKFAAIAAAVFAVVGGGIVAWKRTHRPPPQPTTQELALKFDAENLAYDRHLSDAIKKYTQLADLHGALAPAAQQKIQDLTAIQQQETTLMADGKAAETSNDLARARTDYEKTIALQGEREAEAKASIEVLSEKQAGLSDADIATQSFQAGVTSFNARDYARAKTSFEQALQRSAEDWPQRAQATTYVRRSAARIFQAQLLKRAQYEFSTQDVESARNDAQQSASNADGDPQATSEARKLLAKIKEAPAGANAAGGATGTAATIQQLTEQAQSLIQVGLYSAADDKANRIAQLGGNADPTYNLIKEAEEKKFHELDSRYRVIDRHNLSDLQSLQAAILQLQNNGFYEKQDAKQDADAIAGDIRALLPKPAASDSPTAKPVDDAGDILRVVNRFANAFSQGNLNQIKEAWRLSPKQEKKFNDILVTQPSAPVSLSECSAPNIKTKIGGDTAQITCQVTSGYRDYPSKKIKYSLQREGLRWVIVDSH